MAKQQHLTLQQIDALFYRITKALEEKDPNKNKNYTMTESEVKKLVEERLSKLNLSLSTYKFKNACNNIDVYQAVKLEEIPKCKKQFCYIRDVFHGENILCQGWMQVQGLFSFERKLQFLLENYKKCEVECRKLDLENDFK